MRSLFERTSASEEGDDPWWSYFVAHVRNVDDLFAELRRPFLMAADR